MSAILYYSLLLVCISLGSCYKKITDVDMKRNYGTGLGLILVCLTCGHYVLHSALMVWGNIIIIKCCDRRYSHQISLAYTWMYLLYLHFHINDIYIIWLYQTLALKLVGLAFEINGSQFKVAIDTKRVSLSKMNIGDTENNTPEPSAADIIAYAFYFIGLHRGPYYRWKTFHDHFYAPFSALGDCRIITEQKLKKAALCGLGYWILFKKYSPELYNEDIFYDTYGADFRYLYNIPQLAMYFLYYQAVMMLCTSVFTETGFGVYPAQCQPIPGYGPTSRLSFLTLAASSPDVAMEEEYNFSMLKCFNNEGLLIGPKMKDTMQSWDMPTRFWFWAYVHKTFLKANREVHSPYPAMCRIRGEAKKDIVVPIDFSYVKFKCALYEEGFLHTKHSSSASLKTISTTMKYLLYKSAFSLLAWTIWSGPSLPQFIIAVTLWVYVHLEAEYTVLYDTTGPMKLPWDIGFSIMRLFCLLYLTPCFVVKNTEVVLKYYNSIFWVFHIILLLLMAFSVILYKFRRIHE